MKKILLCLLCVLVSGCDSDSTIVGNSKVDTPIEPWLENKASQVNIDFEWVSGDTGTFNMPEIIGGGAALLDYDNDGDLDLYFVQGGYLDTQATEQNILFRNDGNVFTDVTSSSGTGDTGYGMGVTTGDFDNDGFTDLYITNVGKNSLLRNNRDGTFSNVTDLAAVGDVGWGASAAFSDFDNDGDLDLYVVNYLSWEHGLKIDCYNAKGIRDYCSPTNYMAPEADVVYKNNGDGTFTNITQSAGLGTKIGTGLGILCNDYTGDGFIDIFVANDGMPDQLWKNNGDWTFTDVAPLRGCALDDEGKAKAGMGVTTQDFDSDGDLDILVCNLFGESDSLYRNDGDYFTDITASKGIRTATRHATRFGIGWVDFNNDGILDLYEANGGVQQIGTPITDDPFAEKNYLLQGTENAWDRINGVIHTGIHTSRSAVFGDLNNDGGIDIVVVNKDAPAYVLLNVHPNRGHSVMFNVLNENGSPAIGAILSAVLGSASITKPVQSAWSYMAANDPRVHIGLGAQDSVQDVQVTWIDGTTTTYGEFRTGIYDLRK